MRAATRGGASSSSSGSTRAPEDPPLLGSDPEREAERQSDRSREPRPVDLSAPHTRSAVRPDAEAEGTEPSEVVEVLRDALIRLRVPEVRDSFGDGVEVEIQGSPDHAAAAVADRVAEDVKT